MKLWVVLLSAGLAGCASLLGTSRGAVDHVKLGIELERRGLREQAASRYQAALRAENNYVPALLALGNLALDRGATAKARRYYGRALRIDPNHAGARNNMAMALLAEGRLDEAEALARKALVTAGPLRAYVRDTLAQVQEAKEALWRKRSGKARSASPLSQSP